MSLQEVITKIAHEVFPESPVEVSTLERGVTEYKVRYQDQDGYVEALDEVPKKLTVETYLGNKRREFEYLRDVIDFKIMVDQQGMSEEEANAEITRRVRAREDVTRSA